MKSIHNKDYKTFINLLTEMRKNANITQVRLAKKLKTDRTVISKWETCERRLDFIELRNVCKALKVSLTEFIETFEKRLRDGRKR